MGLVHHVVAHLRRAMSRTQDLINQIKQITIEICDIKNRKKVMDKIETRTTSTFNVHNHYKSDPLQKCHEEHDVYDIHYKDSTRIVHQ